ncbi:MAG: hypothetical protein DI565_05530 [Ancylobacter novellus]|uniref:ABC transporter domain-containing protein n=1 Tax=Ancylobacter novellus TaxID=921 RepID=A0A2W5KME2_ANCNO|nr:MAG: hypothetical protein DI565_05530 [Ancylobacter novellus]
MNAPLRLSPAPSVDAARPLVRFSDVRKTYRSRAGERRLALDGVSFDLAEGEILAVIGSSGSGKSTIAQLAAGLDAPCAGAVAFGGVDFEAAGARARRSVAVLGADPDLPPERTVRQILCERYEASGACAEGGAVDRLIALLDLSADADREADELSDGGRRRAALGRALAGEPRLLILDEATSALDPAIVQVFLSALARVNAERRLSIIVISHDMTTVTALAPRVLVLDRGRIVESGPTARVFARPDHPVSRRFAAAATGATLPPFLAERLVETPRPNGKALVRLAFEGAAATRPVLTSVARDLGFDFGILAGSLGAAGGEPYGVLIVAAPSDEPYFTASVERLEDAGLGVEVLGFVG